MCRVGSGENNMIPKKFFVTSGKAISKVSEINAFDLALREAGIAKCNLVPVSSILPNGCREIVPEDIPVGSITYVVLAKMECSKEKQISAGIAWVWEKYEKFGLVMEAHGYGDQNKLKKTLEKMIKEMAKIRNIEISNIDYRVDSTNIPPHAHGCVLAALVFIP